MTTDRQIQFFPISPVSATHPQQSSNQPCSARLLLTSEGEDRHFEVDSPAGVPNEKPELGLTDEPRLLV
jgi:hypothetical protein